MQLRYVVIAIVVVLGIGAYLGYESLEAPANQVFGRTIVSGSPSAREVALTFDDGPNPPYTDRILDVLRAERVHATFFVVGRAAVAHPATLRRIVADGNALGNHTWDHAHLVVETRAQIVSELQRTDDAIHRIAGVRPRLMRPPFGARDFEVIDVARQLGYQVVMWSVPLPNDWEQPGDETIAARVVGNVTDGGIVVLHDGNRGLICGARSIPAAECDRAQDVAATRRIIEALRAEGYRFVTIPELLAERTARHEGVTHIAGPQSR